MIEWSPTRELFTSSDAMHRQLSRVPGNERRPFPSGSRRRARARFAAGRSLHGERFPGAGRRRRSRLLRRGVRLRLGPVARRVEPDTGS